MPFPHARPVVRAFRLAPVSIAPALKSVRLRGRAVVPKDIRVEGLQRTDAGTVFAALPFLDTYNDDKGAAALRALFATGPSRTCGSTSTTASRW
jgi:outer membrane protein insertion porin family